jgi:GDP-D-mannose dehydratase
MILLTFFSNKEYLQGNPAKALASLGWKPTVKFEVIAICYVEIKK